MHASLVAHLTHTPQHSLTESCALGSCAPAPGARPFFWLQSSQFQHADQVGLSPVRTRQVPSWSTPLPAAAASMLGEAPKVQACLDTDPWTGNYFPNQNRTAEVLPALRYLCLKAELKVPGFASEQNQPQLYRKDISHSNCSCPGFSHRTNHGA